MPPSHMHLFSKFSCSNLSTLDEMNIKYIDVTQPSICPLTCQSLCPSICLSFYLSVSLSVSVSVCLSFYLSVCLSICLSVCPILFFTDNTSIFLFLNLNLVRRLLFLIILLYQMISIALCAW